MEDADKRLHEKFKLRIKKIAQERHFTVSASIQIGDGGMVDIILQRERLLCFKGEGNQGQNTEEYYYFFACLIHKLPFFNFKV
jgi:hypothetical protein